MSTVNTTTVVLSGKYTVRLVEYTYDMSECLWWELLDRRADVKAEGPAFTKEDALELALQAAVQTTLEAMGS